MGALEFLFILLLLHSGATQKSVTQTVERLTPEAIKAAMKELATVLATVFKTGFVHEGWYV